MSSLRLKLMNVIEDANTKRNHKSANSAKLCCFVELSFKVNNNNTNALVQYLKRNKFRKHSIDVVVTQIKTTSNHHVCFEQSLATGLHGASTKFFQHIVAAATDFNSKCDISIKEYEPTTFEHQQKILGFDDIIFDDTVLISKTNTLEYVADMIRNGCDAAAATTTTTTTTTTRNEKLKHIQFKQYSDTHASNIGCIVDSTIVPMAAIRVRLRRPQQMPTIITKSVTSRKTFEWKEKGICIDNSKFHSQPLRAEHCPPFFVYLDVKTTRKQNYKSTATFCTVSFNINTEMNDKIFELASLLL